MIKVNEIIKKNNKTNNKNSYNKSIYLKEQIGTCRLGTRWYNF